MSQSKGLVIQKENPVSLLGTACATHFQDRYDLDQSLSCLGSLIVSNYGRIS